MNESNRVSLRIANSKILCAIGSSSNGTWRNAVREKVTSHFRQIIGSECNFGEPVFQDTVFCFGRCWLQQQSLVRGTHEKTGLPASVLRTADCQPENIGVKLAGSIDVANVDRYMIDARDARAPWLFLGRCKDFGLKRHTQRKQRDCILRVTRDPEQTLHDSKILSQVTGLTGITGNQLDRHVGVRMSMSDDPG